MSAFCGELQKAEFEGDVIRKRTLAGLKAARVRDASAAGRKIRYLLTQIDFSRF